MRTIRGKGQEGSGFGGQRVRGLWHSKKRIEDSNMMMCEDNCGSGSREFGVLGFEVGLLGVRGLCKRRLGAKNGHKTVLSLLGSSLAAGNEAMMKVCVR